MEEKTKRLSALDILLIITNINISEVVTVANEKNQDGSAEHPLDLGEAGGSLLYQAVFALAVSRNLGVPVTLVVRSETASLLYTFDALATTYALITQGETSEEEKTIIRRLGATLGKYGFTQVEKHEETG